MLPQPTSVIAKVRAAFVIIVKVFIAVLSPNTISEVIDVRLTRKALVSRYAKVRVKIFVCGGECQ
jgi:hypothetical protein